VVVENGLGGVDGAEREELNVAAVVAVRKPGGVLLR
jgi:hypothetical protein